MDFLIIAAVFAVIYAISVWAQKSIDTMFAAIDAERKQSKDPRKSGYYGKAKW